MSRLDLKLIEIGSRATEVVKQVERKYPPGSRVGVFLRDGQINPTPAEVLAGHVELSHFGGSARAYLRVRLLTGQQIGRDVSLKNVADLKDGDTKGARA